MMDFMNSQNNVTAYVTAKRQRAIGNVKVGTKMDPMNQSNLHTADKTRDDSRGGPLAGFFAMFMSVTVIILALFAKGAKKLLRR